MFFSKANTRQSALMNAMMNYQALPQRIKHKATRGRVLEDNRDNGFSNPAGRMPAKRYCRGIAPLFALLSLNSRDGRVADRPSVLSLSLQPLLLTVVDCCLPLPRHTKPSQPVTSLGSTKPLVYRYHSPISYQVSLYAGSPPPPPPHGRQN